MFPSSTSILEEQRKRQETYLAELNFQIQEGYRLLRLTISERNKCITHLAHIENSIAILSQTLGAKNVE